MISYSGPFCKPLSVQLNQSTPSPFANPPNLSKSIYSSPLKSSSRSSHHRIQNISTSSSEEEEEDGEEEDSEEEKWPIRKQDPSRYQSTSYLVPDHDSLQVWDQEGRRSTYLISMKKTSERRKQFEEIHHKTIQRVNERQEAVYEEQMNELSKVLEQIELDQSREIRTIKEGFERRERDRLKVFDELIRKAEEIEKEETLRVFKIKQEEAEKKAREERQAEEERNRSEVQARLEKDQLRLKNELELRKKEVMEKKRIEKDLEDSLDRNQKDSLKENYMKWYRVIEQIKQTVLPNVSSNESFKTICRQAKRKITLKVGQLTNSSKQIQKVIIELGEVLQQTKQSDLNVYIWACNHLSKALIKQSETEVTAKPSTVYPLSRVVIGLILIGYPELGQVMMARIVKKCYFVTSHRPIKFETESDELYGKRLGYLVGGGRKNDEGLVHGYK
ncbi:uncharacterized protein MELLADRAFT_90528 [Melampsora larici-populina 98AG31]|uniref:mRNA export factor GLE1 n=1 Tax=Melampsora larici-populina (strain 98AG31 / pathotype 3-4-7) TaxID=747676 RepID=F4RX82_MELLP|nr:uncharacterized protein MELLADRAFT_90528 [Melampsora larici-populina 98AG31]EGG03034.1 hypothetical protein MELLADRAFT_90528 [Melampsora larici-populina 98AG31]